MEKINNIVFNVIKLKNSKRIFFFFEKNNHMYDTQFDRRKKFFFSFVLTNLSENSHMIT